MRILTPVLIALFLTSSPIYAEGQGVPWRLSAKTGSVESWSHVALNLKEPENIVVCYCDGLEDTFIKVVTTDSASENIQIKIKVENATNNESSIPVEKPVKATVIYQSGCSLVGGTTIKILNPNTSYAAGSFYPESIKYEGICQ